MDKQQREWNIFGHVLTTTEFSVSILMLVALLSGVAGIWLGPVVNVVLVACLAAIAVLVWRMTIKHKVMRIALFVIEAVIGVILGFDLKRDTEADIGLLRQAADDLIHDPCHLWDGSLGLDQGYFAVEPSDRLLCPGRWRGGRRRRRRFLAW